MRTEAASLMRRLLTLGALQLAIIVLCALALVGVYLLPNEPVRSHMPTSIQQLDSERYPFFPLVGLTSVAVDNFTDAMMLNESLRPTDESALRQAFGNYLQTVTSLAEAHPIDDLKMGLAGTGNRDSYARYWHGYQVVLRPLLMVLDYRAVRVLSFWVLGLLIAASLYLVRHRLGRKAAAALAGGLASVWLVIVPMSMQLSGTVHLALLGVIAATLALSRDGRLGYDLELFLVLGALTSFIDVLSTPLLTLGLPLTVVLMARIDSEELGHVKAQWLLTVRLALTWAAGWTVMWVSKWVLSSIVLGHSIAGDVLSSATYRISGSEPGASLNPLRTIFFNAISLFPVIGWHRDIATQWTVIATMSLIPLVALFVLLVWSLRNRRKDGRVSRVFGLLPAGIMPFVWYVVLDNHSSVHYWMTYRCLAITVVAVLFAMVYSVEPARLRALTTRLSTVLAEDESVLRRLLGARTSTSRRASR